MIGSERKLLIHEKVDHVVVCGHYDCEVIKQELAGEVLHGWDTYDPVSSSTHVLTAFRDVPKLDPSARRPSNVSQIPDTRSRAERFEETYVLEEVEWLRSQANVEKAVGERGLQIHAFVYDKGRNGCVRLIEESSENL
jgi:carbonic anhydrase